MIRLAIFDLDGTAGDTLESLAYTVNLCMKKHNLPEMPVANFNYYAGDGAKEMLKRCLKDTGNYNSKLLDQMLDEYWELFHTGCTYHVKSYDGLPEILDKLKHYGISLAICTNKAQPYAEAVIETIYGYDLFDYILGEQDGISRKPSPEGVLKIAAEFAVEPEECIYIGDTNTDMQTGKAADMYTVGVTWGFRTREELEEFHADYIIDKPEELLHLPL